MSDNPLMKWGERDLICALARGRPRGTGPVPLLAKQVRFGFCVLPVRRCLVAVYENAADLPVLIQPQKIGPGPRA
jgi:hypothetical protein